MSEYVLDSSALLALMVGEAGAEKVEPLLGASVISSVNLCEVITKLTLCGVPAPEALAATRDLVTDVIDFGSDIALIAAELAPQDKPLGLPLGDRAYLATALHLKREAVTADRTWNKLPFPVFCIR